METRLAGSALYDKRKAASERTRLEREALDAAKRKRCADRAIDDHWNRQSDNQPSGPELYGLAEEACNARNAEVKAVDALLEFEENQK